jgi:undecaprenyl-diphosphatase
MNVFEAIILGLVQGMTEFLPVSSSGHLALFSILLGVDPSQVMSFAAMLHMGTLLAVFVVMRREVLALFRQPFGRLTGLLLFGDFIETAFGGSYLAPSFLLTAAILAINLFVKPGNRPMSGIRWLDALITGGAQAVAVLPGVSRSGSTMTALLARGVEREAAIRFSFLLSIPAILGGFALDVVSLAKSGAGFGGTPVTTVAAGVLTAALSGFLAMRFMLRRLGRRGMLICAAYVALLGVFLLVDKAWLHLL